MPVARKNLTHDEMGPPTAENSNMVTIEKPWYSVGISPKQDDIIASRNIYLFIETLVNNIMAIAYKSNIGHAHLKVRDLQIWYGDNAPLENESILAALAE